MGVSLEGSNLRGGVPPPPLSGAYAFIYKMKRIIVGIGLSDKEDIEEE